MRYISTRGGGIPLTASQAIVKGLSDDGGLYVPEKIPEADFSLSELAGMDYVTLAYEILKLFLTDFSKDELMRDIIAAYSDNFNGAGIAPLVKNGDIWFLELFRGRTLAFKDIALSLMPRLMVTAASKTGIKGEIAILAATSGDTGKAALEGFKDVPGTRIIVFYPEDGVSVLQKRQMTTQEGNNTHVIGVRGSFDDAQNGVKAMFEDKLLKSELEPGIYLTSANSINIGRLLPQIVYYFYAYGQLITNGLRTGEKLDFVVPTGNFGNILAGYYAKRMGLPIGTLVCASNENKVLYDFFTSKVYDTNRDFIKTMSPSMDILISSNFERLAYDSLKSHEKLCGLVHGLKTAGRYTLDRQFPDFAGYYAAQDEMLSAIAKVYMANGYIMDPHTAVAYAAYQKYGQRRETVIISTASPYKFTKTVISAIAPLLKEAQQCGVDDSNELDKLNDFELIKYLAEIKGEAAPPQIAGLKDMQIRHNQTVDRSAMSDALNKYLKSSK